ncbi:MAG: 30S ribosomal protein S17 [bacterium]
MKVFSGKVIAKKMQNTATVEVVRTVVHPMYKKRYRKAKKYHVHDETDVKVGQKVKFVACKPYSKIKKWKIIEVVEKKGDK